MQDRAPINARPAKHAFRSSLIAGLFLVAMLAGVAPAGAADVGGSAVPDSFDAGVVTSYTMTFTGTSLANNTTVTFPAGFDLSLVTEDDASHSAPVIGAKNVNATAVVFTDMPMLAASYTVIIGNVTNPGTPGDYTINVTTRQGATIVDWYTVDVAIAAGTGSLATATSFDYGSFKAGDLDADFTVNVTPEASGGFLQLLLPAGFNASDSAQKLSSNLVVGKAATLTADESTLVTFNDIDLPAFASTDEIVLIVRATDASSSAVDSGSASAAVPAGDLAVAYENANWASKKANKTHTIKWDITPANAVPENGTISVTFPAGFDLLNGSFGGADVFLSNAGSAVEDANYTVAIDAANRTVNVTIHNESLAADVEHVLSMVNIPHVPAIIGTTEAFEFVTNNTDGERIDTDSDLTFEVLANSTPTVNFFALNNSVAGNTTGLVINVTTGSSGVADALIRFPDSVDVSGVTGGTASDQNVTVTTAPSEGGYSNFTLDNIDLPHAIGDLVIDFRFRNASAVELEQFQQTLTLGANAPLIEVNQSTPGFSLSAGGLSSYDLNVTAENPVVNGSQVIVEFPTGFGVSNVNVGTDPTQVSVDGNLIAAENVTASGRMVTIDLNETSVVSADTRFNVTIHNVTNAMVSGATGNFSVQIKNATGALLDDGETAAAQNPVLTGADGINVTGLTIISGGTSNVTTSIQVTVEPTITVPVAGNVSIIWDPAVDMTGASVKVAGTSATASVSTAGDNILNFTVPSGAQLTADEEHAITISGFTAPANGTYDLTGVKTYNVTGGILEDQAFTKGLIIAAGAITVTLDANATGSLNPVVGSTTTYEFTLRTTADLTNATNGGSVNITFPASYDITGLSPVLDSPPGTIAVTTDRNIEVTLDDALTAGQAIVVTVPGVVNPSVAGATATFNVSTYDSGATIDQDNATKATIRTAADPLTISKYLYSGKTGETVAVNLTFTNSTTLLGTDELTIHLPEGFDATGTAADFNGVSVTGVSVSGTMVVLGLGDGGLVGSTDGTNTVNLTGVQLPRQAGTPGVIRLVINTTGGVDVEEGTKASTAIIASGFKDDSHKVIPGQAKAGHEEGYTVQATPNVTTEVGDQFIVTFPAGFDLTTAGTPSFNNGTTAHIEGQQVIGNVTSAGTGALSIFIPTITNPTTLGNTSAFVFDLKDSDGNSVHTNTTETVEVIAAPSLVVPTLSNITEGGSPAQLSISLGGTRSDVVVLDVTSSSTGVATVSPATLTFQPADGAKTITITPVDDDLDNVGDSRSATITVAVDDAATLDGNYDTLASKQIAVNVADDDTAGLTVSTNVAVSEEGPTSNNITVKLSSKPAATVTVSVSQVTSSQANVSAALSPLTFTSANWNVAQNVLVTAVDDSVSEGSHTAAVVFTAASSDDKYNGLTKSSSVVVSDNDLASVIVTESGDDTEVTEGVSAGDTYTVVLGKAPTASVTITMNASAQVTTDKATLTFTTANWATPQTVKVTAVDDDDLEGTHSGSVKHNATSSDASYNALSVSTVSVTVIDNDDGIILTEIGGDTEVEEGVENDDTYRLELTTRPSATVNITISAEDGLNVTPAFVLFNSTNWDDRQTVTITADDNDVEDGDRVLTINHTSVSTDSDYDGLTLSLDVNVTDDDSETPASSGTLEDSEIETSNKQVKVTVTRSGNSNRIEWELPEEPLADVEGIQIWFSNSPYSLLQTYDKDTTVFGNKAFTHLGEDAKATTKYLVTMFYADGEGRFNADDAPDTDTYLGTSSEDDDSDDDDSITGKWWFWLLIVIAVLIIAAIVVVIVLTVLRNRSDDEDEYDDWEDDDVGWDDDAEGDDDEPEAPETVAPASSEVHHIHCPRCSHEFNATGAKPLTTTCPNCDARGILR